MPVNKHIVLRPTVVHASSLRAASLGPISCEYFGRHNVVLFLMTTFWVLFVINQMRGSGLRSIGLVLDLCALLLRSSIEVHSISEIVACTGAPNDESFIGRAAQPLCNNQQHLKMLITSIENIRNYFETVHTGYQLKSIELKFLANVVNRLSGCCAPDTPEWPASATTCSIGCITLSNSD